MTLPQEDCAFVPLNFNFVNFKVIHYVELNSFYREISNNGGTDIRPPDTTPPPPFLQMQGINPLQVSAKAPPSFSER